MMDMMYGDRYKNEVFNLLKRIEKTQRDLILQAAGIIYNSLAENGLLHVFSTGHSHIIIEELFYRSGGLVPINPIFDPATMLHEGVVKSTRLEKLSGYAEAIFEGINTREREPILIISNSGINAVPIEMAMLARERGMSVIAVTSKNISGNLDSRHASRKKLMDIANLVIDNCVIGRDGAIVLEKTGQYFGPLSSIAGIYIVNRLVVEVVGMFLESGQVPPVFKSANVPGGDEYNKKLINRYKERIKGFE